MGKDSEMIISMEIGKKNSKATKSILGATSDARVFFFEYLLSICYSQIQYTDPVIPLILIPRTPSKEALSQSREATWPYCRGSRIRRSRQPPPHPSSRTFRARQHASREPTSTMHWVIRFHMCHWFVWEMSPEE